MMFILSFSSPILSCCYIFLIFFFQSSCTAYTIDSNELANHFMDEQWGGVNRLSDASNRHIRTTKFPRIGRSFFDSEEKSSLLDMNTSNEENSEEMKMLEQRSVLFPRIGKRAFHNLLWANSRSNPHRMLDGQGRYYINGYDYHIHQVRPHALSRYRTKRNIAM